jgi:long-subunit fatty acid transport protein
MGGDNTKSLTDYMAGRAMDNKVPASNLSLGGGNDHWNVWDSQDWLTVLGYNSGLIVPASDGFISSTRYKDNIDNGLPVYNDLYSEEKGAVSSYDFNIGTSFSDIISVGATVSMTDVNYRLYSRYTEDFLDMDGSKEYWGGYDLYNWIRTDGTGWQVKAGVIVRPVDELRIGVSYHSPTWYKMTDHFAANLDHNLTDLKDNTNLLIPSDYKKGIIESYNGEEDAVYDYRLRTPDKWTLSLAGVIGGKAIISADYELTDYKNNMKLFDRNNSTLARDPNEYIKEDFRMASALRVGLEYRITNKFSGRVGYSWVQSPVQASIKNGDKEVTTDPRPVTQYAFDADTQYITYGLGYQFLPTRRGGLDADLRDQGYFYTDSAFVMRSQKADIYAFNGADKGSLKTNSFQGLLTLGYKFSMPY